MKVMLLFPKMYSYFTTIEKAAKKNSCSVVSLDYYDFFPNWNNQLVIKTSGLPRNFRYIVGKNYIEKINKKYLEKFREEKPDIVIIYNNQLLVPETLREIKIKAKIVFYLGDNPLFSHTNDYNLFLLNYSDVTICPDTYWIFQLQSIGIKNLIFDFFGWDDEIYHPLNPSQIIKENEIHDAVFIGRTYMNSWGYKRMSFLNGFRDFDLKIYASGKGWEKWSGDFPGLKSKIVKYNGFDPSFNNTAYNNSKLTPVDSNPGTFNGIHIRTLDSLGSGAMPIIEYKMDYEQVFNGIDIFYVKNYKEISEIASYYLCNEKKRLDTIEKMRKAVHDKYRPELTFKRILEILRI